MENEKQFTREKKMIRLSETIMIRLSTLRHIEKLTETELHFIGEIIFRLQQLKIAIERVSVDFKKIDNFEMATLDVESIYWLTFRIIKCLQKISVFGTSWGGGFGISIMRNKVLEHFVPDKSGKYRNFSLSYPEKGVVYRDPSFGAQEDSVLDHLEEFLTKVISKLPDRDDELRALIRAKTEQSKSKQ